MTKIAKAIEALNYSKNQINKLNLELPLQLLFDVQVSTDKAIAAYEAMATEKDSEAAFEAAREEIRKAITSLPRYYDSAEVATAGFALRMLKEMLRADGGACSPGYFLEQWQEWEVSSMPEIQHSLATNR